MGTGVPTQSMWGSACACWAETDDEQLSSAERKQPTPPTGTVVLGASKSIKQPFVAGFQRLATVYRWNGASEPGAVGAGGATACANLINSWWKIQHCGIYVGGGAPERRAVGAGRAAACCHSSGMLRSVQFSGIVRRWRRT